MSMMTMMMMMKRSLQMISLYCTLLLNLQLDCYTVAMPPTYAAALHTCRTEFPAQHLPSRRAFSVVGPTAWNSLPDFTRDPTSSTDCLGVYSKRTCSRVTSASSATAVQLKAVTYINGFVKPGGRCSAATTYHNPKSYFSSAQATGNKHITDDVSCSRMSVIFCVLNDYALYKSTHSLVLLLAAWRSG